jgi:holo-[acyl-carrier protein] synthase
MIGVGIDIVSVARIAALLERYGDRFLDRCFAPSEVALARRRGPAAAQALAARFAAKEAFLKALGLGLGAVPLRRIEVTGGSAAGPSIRWEGPAAAAVAAAGGKAAHLSLSHEKDHAVAIVVVI